MGVCVFNNAIPGQPMREQCVMSGVDWHSTTGRLLADKFVVIRSLILQRIRAHCCHKPLMIASHYEAAGTLCVSPDLPCLARTRYLIPS